MATKFFSHARIERNVTVLAVLSLLVVTIGGIVEIAPLFWIDSTIEKANEDLVAQASPDTDPADIMKRYPKAQVRDFDGDPNRTTE
ncbi:MAG TPA: cbb3-type cytochrome c oxidase subunit II, partial [Sphingomicrobium sp.]|nr:cbb3-type cytochrome c oxidase subunit II [Sphingomicrobium sp.]